jgi:hypothetical protein
MDATGRTARRFPLIARPRPAADPLPARIYRLREQAATAEDRSDPVAASAVLNLAALIAADCGRHSMARRLSLAHARAYLGHTPLAGAAVRHALEPAVNLARLHIRASQGDTALAILDALSTAVRERDAADVAGLHLPADLAGDDAGHAEAVQWLWTVLLADGTHALTAAGRWGDALTHLRRHQGVGTRMLDGRQVAVVTAIVTADHAEAETLLAETTRGEPWEQAVAVCLTVLGRQAAGRPIDETHTIMMREFAGLSPDPQHVVFRTRLGLCVLDALGGIAGHAVSHDSRVHLNRLAEAVLDVRDGTAARDLLANASDVLDRFQCDALSTVVAASGIGQQILNGTQRRMVDTAVGQATAVLARVLSGGPVAVPGPVPRAGNA